ncbi:MAG: hypothetical protein ACI9FU_000455 [Granulosicoccus sp.]|jgi:hypothetical protein
MLHQSKLEQLSTLGQRQLALNSRPFMGKISTLVLQIKWLTGIVLASMLVGCESFDPVEDPPSFIRIEDFTFNTTPSQGEASERIEDVWVTVGSEFIGVFPIPSNVPIIGSGEMNITIAPGIRLNGISAARLRHPYYTSHTQTLNLIPDSVLNITPSFSFTDAADFAWVEEFEEFGIKLISIAESDIERVDDPDIALNGYSGLLNLQPAELRFECKSDQKFNLPGSGNAVFLEFDYKGNNPMIVGVFITNPGEIIQQPVITLLPSDNWKRIYLNMTDYVSGNPNNLGIEPFFGFIRDEVLEGDATVYLDNIKLVY